MSSPPSFMAQFDRMPPSRTAFLLFASNATLAICHEIDAASWREWEMIHLPGGSQAFVALHFLLVPFLLVGLIAIATGHRWSRGFLLATSISGLTGFFFHIFMLAFGDLRFREPFSCALILGFGFTSMALLFAGETITTRHHSRREAAALNEAGYHLRRHLTTKRPVRRPG